MKKTIASIVLIFHFLFLIIVILTPVLIIITKKWWWIMLPIVVLISNFLFGECLLHSLEERLRGFKKKKYWTQKLLECMGINVSMEQALYVRHGLNILIILIDLIVILQNT